jgi:hypothetical protein
MRKKFAGHQPKYKALKAKTAEKRKETANIDYLTRLGRGPE